MDSTRIVTICTLQVAFAFALLFFNSQVSGKRHEIRLDDKFLFAWEVNSENRTIHLEATGETQGYVGLGLNRKGKMDKAEMGIGGVHSENGQSYHGVYTGHKHKVRLDKKRKWTLLEASQNGTHTYLKYERPLGGKNNYTENHVIGENDVILPNYVPIKDKDIYVIWALGKSDKLKKHHGHGRLKVNLINPNLNYLETFNSEMYNFYLDL